MPKSYYHFENLNLTLQGNGWKIAVAAIGAGILAAVLAALILRVYHHRIVKALVRNEASGLDSARTLGELGLGNSRFIRRLLRPGTPLGKIIGVENEEEQTKKGPTDAARLYLPEEKRIGAELRFSEERHPVITFIVFAVLITAATVFVMNFLPGILGAADKLIGQIRPDSKYL